MNETIEEMRADRDAWREKLKVERKRRWRYGKALRRLLALYELSPEPDEVKAAVRSAKATLKQTDVHWN